MYEGNVLNLEPNGAIVAAVVLAAFQGWAPGRVVAVVAGDCDYRYAASSQCHDSNG